MSMIGYIKTIYWKQNILLISKRCSDTYF